MKNIYILNNINGTNDDNVLDVSHSAKRLRQAIAERGVHQVQLITVFVLVFWEQYNNSGCPY